jgi:hypothetical protein
MHRTTASCLLTPSASANAVSRRSYSSVNRKVIAMKTWYYSDTSRRRRVWRVREIAKSLT